MHFSYIITLLAATASAIPASGPLVQRRDAANEVSKREPVAAEVLAMYKREELASLIKRGAELAEAYKSAALDMEMVKRDNVVADIGTTVHDLDTLVKNLVSGALKVTATLAKNLDTVVKDLEKLVAELLKDVLSGALKISTTVVYDLEAAIVKLEKIVAQIDGFVNKTLTPDLFNALNAVLAELETIVGKL